MRAAIQTRASPSIAKLCAVVCVVQMASEPQYGDGCVGGVFAMLGVCGSRTFRLIRVAVWVLGSTTGM
jgi:hypothetical protein